MISIIICTKNASNYIDAVLSTTIGYPVILVDKSTDNTKEIARKYAHVKVIHQDGEGLADARNQGLKHVKTKFVFMLGSDNLLCDKRYNKIDLNKIKDYMEEKGWVGCGLRNINNGIGYFSECMRIRARYKFREGTKKVVGTPVLYLTKVLKNIAYDPLCTHSDDTILAERLKRKGYKQGYCNREIKEINYKPRVSFYEIIDKWIRYGTSDREYYKRYGKSLLHPIKTEWVPKLYYLPFYIMVVYIRYLGWLK